MISTVCLLSRSSPCFLSSRACQSAIKGIDLYCPLACIRCFAFRSCQESPSHPRTLRALRPWGSPRSSRDSAETADSTVTLVCPAGLRNSYSSTCNAVSFTDYSLTQCRPSPLYSTSNGPYSQMASNSFMSTPSQLGSAATPTSQIPPVPSVSHEPQELPFDPRFVDGVVKMFGLGVDAERIILFMVQVRLCPSIFCIY